MLVRVGVGCSGGTEVGKVTKPRVRGTKCTKPRAHLTGVLLIRVAHGEHLLLAVLGIVVKVDLGIEAHHCEAEIAPYVQQGISRQNIYSWSDRAKTPGRFMNTNKLKICCFEI